MSKIFKAFSQYRIEAAYSIIALSGSGVLFLQYQSTKNFAWFIALNLFCTKMVLGIINYEKYCQSNKLAMKSMLRYLLLKFV